MKRMDIWAGQVMAAILKVRKTRDPRLFMEHVDKGFQPGVFVRSQPGFS